jgi:ribosomal protein L37E
VRWGWGEWRVGRRTWRIRTLTQVSMCGLNCDKDFLISSRLCGYGIIGSRGMHEWNQKHKSRERVSTLFLH